MRLLPLRWAPLLVGTAAAAAASGLAPLGPYGDGRSCSAGADPDGCGDDAFGALQVPRMASSSVPNADGLRGAVSGAASPDFVQLSGRVARSPEDSAYKWFCNHDSRSKRFYADCSACLNEPICCSNTSVKVSSSTGHEYCTPSKNTSKCDWADRPGACGSKSALCSVMSCNDKCTVEKALFETSISKETGKYFPYYYCPDYAADLDTSQPHVETMVIVLHGGASNGDEYLCRVQNAVAIHFGNQYRKVGLISLQFHACYRDNKPYCNKDKDLIHDKIPNELYWKQAWYYGYNSSANSSKQISSYTVIDELLASFVDHPSFPNLKRIKVVGYSGGAMFFTRYGVFGNYYDTLAAAGLDIEFFLGGMRHAAYFDRRRPVIAHPEACTLGPGGYCVQEEIRNANYAFADPGNVPCRFNHWPFGVEGGLNEYMQRVDVAAAIEAFRNRKVTYFLGELELCNTDIIDVNDTCYKQCKRITSTKMPAPKADLSGTRADESPSQPTDDADENLEELPMAHQLPQQLQQQLEHDKREGLGFGEEWAHLYKEWEEIPPYWQEYEEYEFCAFDLQGHCAYMQQTTWVQYLDLYYGGIHRHRAVTVPTSHDGCATWQSPVARKAIFGNTDACRLP